MSKASNPLVRKSPGRPGFSIFEAQTREKSQLKQRLKQSLSEMLMGRIMRPSRRNKEFEIIPGINIQWPWSAKILSGEKTVETRNYPLPEKYRNVRLAIIETPGRLGKTEGISKARVIGTVKFSGSFKYENQETWKKDKLRHCVAFTDSQFLFQEGKTKWGWEITEVIALGTPLPAPDRRHRGIIFASKVSVPSFS